MTWLNSEVRGLLRARGTAARWLRAELNALKVEVMLSGGCVEALAREADQRARRALQAGGAGGSYFEQLREQVRHQAGWVRRWTDTDEPMPTEDAVAQSVVRIARKYALPRPWKLTEPVAVEVPRSRIAFTWAPALASPAAGRD